MTSTWSNNSNAPQISYPLHHLEVTRANGGIIGAILYGIVIALFFECMTTLLNPDNRMRRGVKWVFVVHTVAIFSSTTISCGIEGARRSNAFIDNREYPGVDHVSSPGPFGYMNLNEASTAAIVSYLAPPLNQWLIDGLLLYRCYVIYSMNYWVIILPGVMYLATVALGVVFIHESVVTPWEGPVFLDVFFSYNFVALSLNVLLTLMIIVRIMLHRRNIINAMGTSAGVSGLYTTVITMLVESCAPYTIAYLLYLVPMATGSDITFVFTLVLGSLQVIAPYLIILRVANRKALTSDVLSSGSGAVGSIRFASQGGSTGDDGSLPDGDPERSMRMNGKVPSEPEAGVENTIDEVPL